MKKLQLPAYDDSTAFYNLANNHRLSSYPQLLEMIVTVHENYDRYVAARGSPELFQDQPITEAQAKYLRAHYASPPTDLKHITEMRESTAHLVCPMCGSYHSGTLDHYLPKNGFPIFSVFSKNLVPACSTCNSARQETLLGEEGERILHPYFDDCLAERLVSARFEDLGKVPRISLVLTIPRDHPDYLAVDFHVQSILRRTAVLRYLASRWDSLFRRPSLVVRAFANNIATQAEVRTLLEVERENLDDYHGSKNSWDSIFISGLLEPAVLVWLSERLTIPGRPPDSELG